MHSVSGSISGTSCSKTQLLGDMTDLNHKTRVVKVKDKYSGLKILHAANIPLIIDHEAQWHQFRTEIL